MNTRPRTTIETHSAILLQRLATPETGEDGLFNLFYTPAGLVELLSAALQITDRTELAVRFDNVQAGRRVPGNSDLVVWGRCP